MGYLVTDEQFEEIREAVTYAFSAGAIGNPDLRQMARKALLILNEIKKERRPEVIGRDFLKEAKGEL